MFFENSCQKILYWVIFILKNQIWKIGFQFKVVLIQSRFIAVLFEHGFFENTLLNNYLLKSLFRKYNNWFLKFLKVFYKFCLIFIFKIIF